MEMAFGHIAPFEFRAAVVATATTAATATVAAATAATTTPAAALSKWEQQLPNPSVVMEPTDRW